MDTGAEPIDDPAELRQVRRRAFAVHAKALATAVALTVITATI